MKKSFQVAALPVLENKKGQLRILLVTSRETKRWVTPKGWPWAKHSKRAAAAREAWEEAGVTGDISRKPIGSFRYEKQLQSRARDVTVSVYLLKVTAIADKWPEAKQRRRRWFTPEAAARAVLEPELRELLTALSVARR